LYKNNRKSPNDSFEEGRHRHRLIYNIFASGSGANIFLKKNIRHFSSSSRLQRSLNPISYFSNKFKTIFSFKNILKAFTIFCVGLCGRFYTNELLAPPALQGGDPALQSRGGECFYRLFTLYISWFLFNICSFRCGDE
jgi:hypothetical protein